MVVHKLDESGVEQWTYPGQVLEQAAEFVRLEARFDRGQVTVGPLVISPGDRFVEQFYFDRWYNIFEIFESESGKFKGWYCNITRPAWIEGQALYAEDLALDLVVLPDGDFAVLDEDEFDRLELSPAERRQARMALDGLLEQAKRKSGPFSELPGV